MWGERTCIHACDMVVIIHKTDNVSEPENSSVSACQVVEQIFHQQLTAFLETYKLIDDSLFGFRLERSGEISLLSVTEPHSGIGKKELFLPCLLNLSKAFRRSLQD